MTYMPKSAVPYMPQSAQPIQPAQPNQSAQDTVEGGVAGAMRNLGMGAATDAMGITRGITNAAKSAFGAQPDANPFISEQQKQDFSQNPVAAITGSAGRDLAGAASWMVPGGTGVLGRAAAGAVTGGLQELSSDKPTLQGGLTKIGAGAILGPTVGAIAEKIPKVLTGLKKFGVSMMEPISSRVVGPISDWASKESDIAQNVLENTKSLFPRSAAKEIEGKLTETTGYIKKYLGDLKDKVKVPFFGQDGLENKLGDYIKGAVPGFNVADNEMNAALAQSKSILQKNGSSMGQGMDTSMNPLSLFEAKQQIGDKLKQLGTWGKLNAAQGVSNAEQVWLSTYRFLKNELDDQLATHLGENSHIGQLTQAEHELMLASESFHNVAHGANSAGNFSLGSAMKRFVAPAEMGIARGAYGVGQQAENTMNKLGGATQVGDALRKLTMQSSLGTAGAIQNSQQQ